MINVLELLFNDLNKTYIFLMENLNFLNYIKIK